MVNSYPLIQHTTTGSETRNHQPSEVNVSVIREPTMLPLGSRFFTYGVRICASLATVTTSVKTTMTKSAPRTIKTASSDALH